MASKLDKQVMIRMRPDQVARLRELAKADDRTLAYMVRKAVDLYLAQHAPTVTPRE